MSPHERARRLAAVLADLRFPAMKWEIITHAEFMGADVRSRTELDLLPPVRYRDLASVISAADLRPVRDDHSGP